MKHCNACRPESYVPIKKTIKHIKKNLKEDILYIGKKLIDGRLGGIPEYEKWKASVVEVRFYP